MGRGHPAPVACLAALLRVRMTSLDLPKLWLLGWPPSAPTELPGIGRLPLRRALHWKIGLPLDLQSRQAL